MKRLLGFFSNLKIKRKVQAFGVISVMFLCVVFAVFYGKVASNIALKRAEESIGSDVNQVRDYLEVTDIAINARLRHAETSITVQQLLLSGYAGTQTEAWSADAVLQDLCSLDMIEAVAIYTMDGELVAESNPEANEIQSPPQEVMQILSSAENKAYWYDDSSWEATRSNQLSVYLLLKKDERPLGILRAKINLHELANFYTELDYGAVSQIYLFSDKGNIILPLTVNRETSVAAREAFEDDRLRESSDAAVYESENAKYLVRKQSAEDFGLYIVDIAVYDQVTQDVKTMQTTILMLGLICVFVQLTFFTAMGGYLSKPIVRLSEQMKEVGAGNLNLRSENNSRDEIGELSRSFNQMLNRIQTLMAEREASEKERHELELASLQLQISPHFFYNSLDSISSLIQLGDNSGAFEMSKAFSNFYRGVLSDGRSIIRLDEEINIIENYLQIQSQRYEGGFDYSIDVAPELMNSAVVKLTLQPLVENSIYHGIRKVHRRGRIDITGKITENGMLLSVRDNGKGMTEKTEVFEETGERGDLILHRKGFGMQNVNQRIKLYFGDSYGLHVDSVPEQWTQVDIYLPIYEYEEYENDFGSDR